MKYTIGLDIGGTKISTGLISKNKILKEIKIPSKAKRNKATIISSITEAIELVWPAKGSVKNIGLAMAGIVDTEKGKFITGPNFSSQFKNIPISSIITKKFKTPTLVDNDANCFALAEAVLGVAKNKDKVIGLTLGTGIGGGIILDQQVYHGAHGYGGELGHMMISPTGPICSCKHFGHLESLGSGSAVVNLYKAKTGKKKNTFDIEQEAIAGKKIANQVFADVATHLSVGIANLINIFDPDMVVLGGGMIRVPLIINPALKQVKKYVAFKKLESTPVKVSRLGDRAGILGAGLIAK